MLMKTTVFTPSSIAGQTSKCKERLALLVSSVAVSMSLLEPDVNI